MRTPVETCCLTRSTSPRPAASPGGWTRASNTVYGLLTAHERSRLAAEDGATSLTRLLRRTELAGRDPEEELRRAVGNAASMASGS